MAYRDNRRKIGETSAHELLRALCAQLANLRTLASGPTLRDLAKVDGLPQIAQLSQILNGKVRRIPDWSVVWEIVEACHRHAQENGIDLDVAASHKIWSASYAAVERAFDLVSKRRPSDAADAPQSARFRINTLPRDVTRFRGREMELRQVVTELAHNDGESLSIMPVYAVNGMAGVGKTAFIVHVAHILALHYQNVLFIDLFGHSTGQTPYDPADALALLIKMLSPDADVPVSLGARIALWRNETATRGCLLILDNAANAEQARPLFPGSAGNAVLVTSRNRLIGLEDVKTIELDVLSESEATDLLKDAAGPSWSDETEWQTAVDRCGNLPLALGLVGGWLCHHPRRTLDDLNAWFPDAAGPASAAFELSLRDLSDVERHFCALLGVHPGPTITLGVAASLAGEDVSHASVQMERLYLSRLIDEPTTGRYKFHDLIRAYVRDLSSNDVTQDRSSALRRLLEFYVEELRSRRNGDGPWVRSEIDNLLACANEAQVAKIYPFAWVLPLYLAVILQILGREGESERLHQRALAAAHDAGDILAEASVYVELNVLARHRGDLETARRSILAAHRLFTTADPEPRLELANCQTEIGVLERDSGNADAARQHLRKALSMYQLVNSSIGQGNAHAALSQLERALGNLEKARLHAQLALDLYSLTDTPLGVATAHSAVAAVDLLEQRYGDAKQHLETALALHASIEDRAGVAEVEAQLETLQTKLRYSDQPQV